MSSNVAGDQRLLVDEEMNPGIDGSNDTFEKVNECAHGPEEVMPHPQIAYPFKEIVVDV